MWHAEENEHVQYLMDNLHYRLIFDLEKNLSEVVKFQNLAISARNTREFCFYCLDQTLV